MPGIKIGPLTITYYGIILMAGALAAAWLAEREARRRGEPPDFVWDGLIWVLIGGIVGARIWHILFPPQSMVAQGITTMYYLTHPLDAISTWRGGLGIPGAVIGGILALYIYARARKVSFATWVDIVAPCLALGQAIGRWGNLINQELYGMPTTLPWGQYIDPEYRLPEFRNVAFYHPLYLYESLFSFANMAFLLWLGRRYPQKLKPGDLFLIYLITYPTARFFLEFLRLDPAKVAGINANQIVMAVVAVASVVALVVRHWKKETPVTI